ncbi:histidine--tRNA ligase [bacterium]|nr:histidine--tRNA ligase [bacterium]
MAKKKGISGFPEWLPEQKRLEDELIRRVRALYESHGFVAIETPAVELIETLTSKGVVDKEIYALRRLAAEGESEAELGLHFDLTVPFARYVAAHFNDLVFPFKRYQLQKVWRGERPQKGRFREFYQFDIDIVARDTLPLACDAEVISVLGKALLALEIGTPRLKLNNRKLLVGYYEGLGVPETEIPAVISIIDKLEKIGEGEAARLLSELPLGDSERQRILEFSTHRIAGADFKSFVEGCDLGSELAEEGAEELVTILALVPEQLLPYIEVQLQIARGLDYYTGTIVESEIVEHPEFGSVGSGGRYEDLVSKYLSKKVPGVGVSLGLTRIMDLILRNDLLPLPSQSPCRVLVTVLNEAERPAAESFGESLRSEGVSTEVFFRSPKLGKQIDYAHKKGIPYVVFLGEEQSVKVLATGEQVSFDALSELFSLLRK